MEILSTAYEYLIVNPEVVPPAYYATWSFLRIVFIILFVFLAGMLVFLLFINEYVKLRFIEIIEEFIRAKPRRKIKLKADWKKNIRQIERGEEGDRKLAIIEIDDTIKDALLQLGYEGDTLGEMLENASKEFIPNLEDLKRAHKIRRDLIYDPNKTLSPEEASELIAIYEEAFRNLQLL